VPSQRIAPREGPPTSAAGAYHVTHMNRGDVLAEVPVKHALMTSGICLVPRTVASASGVPGMGVVPKMDFLDVPNDSSRRGIFQDHMAEVMSGTPPTDVRCCHGVPKRVEMREGTG